MGPTYYRPGNKTIKKKKKKKKQGTKLPDIGRAATLSKILIQRSSHSTDSRAANWFPIYFHYLAWYILLLLWKKHIHLKNENIVVDLTMR